MPAPEPPVEGMPRIRPTEATRPPQSERLLAVDGHVHVHHCFPLDRFLEQAFANMGRAERGVDGEEASTGILLLSESRDVNRFREMRSIAEAEGRLGGWALRTTDEAESMVISPATGDHQVLDGLVLVAGRQIVVKEGLEVLALSTDDDFRDGAGLTDTIRKVRESGAVPVLPWGFGKWWFRRGRLLTKLLQGVNAGDFLLGDNAIRPRGVPSPTHFALAADRGIGVLCGTDPLPFPADVRRAGRFGTLVPGSSFDLNKPAAALRRKLRHLPPDTHTFGRRESLPRFLEAQLRMRLSSC